ncbi:transcription antitermination factor NusB [Aurantivibrio infirmus]
MTTPAARRKARHYAMQALYQWQLTQQEPKDIVKQFKSEYDMSNVDVSYFEELAKSIPKQIEALDQQFINQLLDRELNEIDPITLALLRIACFELVNRIDVPYKVVISEAVSLAKKFGAADSHKFINGVLDKTAVLIRTAEIG